MTETPEDDDLEGTDEPDEDEEPKSTGVSEGCLWAVLAFVVIAVVVVILAIVANDGSGGDRTVTTRKPSPLAPTSVEVAYYVEGSAKSATVTMEQPDGTEQAEIRVPLKNTGGSRGVHFTAPSGQFLYVSAQNTGETGDVTCRITVNGTTVAENTSSGAYSIASCQASAS